MASEAELRGFLAGLHKASQQIKMYGPAYLEGRRELEAILDAWKREGLTELNAEHLDDLIRESSTP